MTRPPKDALRREILDEALRLFGGAGFQATSLQQIADAVGCSKAALLYHFKSKTAILDALVTPLIEEVAQALSRVEGLAWPHDRDEFLQDAVRIVTGHRQVLVALHGLAEMTEISQMVCRGEEYLERIRVLLAGPDPTPLDRAAAVTVTDGLLAAALELEQLPGVEVEAIMVELAGRILQIPRLTVP